MMSKTFYDQPSLLTVAVSSRICNDVYEFTQSLYELLKRISDKGNEET
jgi:hypothetical protein